MTDAPVNSTLMTLAGTFRMRAARLRGYALAILGVIVVLLVVGIALFVAAGELANRETIAAVTKTAEANAAALRSERVSLDREMRVLLRRIDDLRERTIQEAAGVGPSGHMGRGPIVKLLEEQMSELIQRRIGLEQRMAQIDTQIQRLQAPVQVTFSKEAQTASLITAISTRIGAVILLVFLVQILVPLYRYVMRLASFYEARADTIEFLIGVGTPVNHRQFDMIARAFSPDGIDFSTAPPSPVEQAVKLVQEIGKSKD